jgi:hypothetical protein
MSSLQDSIFDVTVFYNHFIPTGFVNKKLFYKLGSLKTTEWSIFIMAKGVTLGIYGNFICYILAKRRVVMSTVFRQNRRCMV